MTKHSSIAVTAALLLAVPTGSAFAADSCVPLQGKISNNAVSAQNTLGVVALEYGPKQGGLKLKCALTGAAQQATPPADMLDFVRRAHAGALEPREARAAPAIEVLQPAFSARVATTGRVAGLR